MKRLKEYVINFGNLKTGTHEFDFEAGNEFFESFEYSIVHNADVHIHLELDKQKETFFIMNFTFKGYITFECDRCLDEVHYPVDDKQRLLVKLSAKEEKETDDELIFLSPETYEFDISPFVYEFINLDLPLKRLCEMAGKECNQKMISYLKEVNNEDKSKEQLRDDSPWDALKSLSNTDNKE